MHKKPMYKTGGMKNPNAEANVQMKKGGAKMSKMIMKKMGKKK